MIKFLNVLYHNFMFHHMGLSVRYAICLIWVQNKLLVQIFRGGKNTFRSTFHDKIFLIRNSIKFDKIELLGNLSTGLSGEGGATRILAGKVDFWFLDRILTFEIFDVSLKIKSWQIWRRHVLHKKSKLFSRNEAMLQGSSMGHQLVLTEVGVIAAGHGALVGLYPCMPPHVIISVTDHRESFGAKLAWVRFLMSVHSSDMSLYDA